MMYQTLKDCRVRRRVLNTYVENGSIIGHLECGYKQVMPPDTVIMHPCRNWSEYSLFVHCEDCALTVLRLLFEIEQKDANYTKVEKMS